jgi:spore germination protein
MNKGIDHMFIYTVKTGDTLFTIGQRFNISYQSILNVNGLTSPNLVPGQSLLIPQSYYTVQSGDSLYSNM